ncbi:hypothetical protein ACP70R_032184 [Stipagrostis hirtigluma subsp. patula]
MESFRRCAAMVIVLSFLLLACEAGVLAGDPPSSSSVAEHVRATPHIRKLLSTSTTVHAPAAATVERMASPGGECSEEAIDVSQHSVGTLADGIPLFSVTITNICLQCKVQDVHLSCGEFASTQLVDPSDFERVAYGDCVVKGGGAMEPGETVSFEYSNSFEYPLAVSNVSCPPGS